MLSWNDIKSPKEITGQNNLSNLNPPTPSNNHEYSHARHALLFFQIVIVTILWSVQDMQIIVTSLMNDQGPML